MKKLILILIILSMCSCSSYSVIGKYVRYLNIEGTAGNTMIVFKNDSTFAIAEGSVNYSGNWNQINKRTIILTFDPIPEEYKRLSRISTGFGFMTDTVKIYPHYNAILLDNWIYLRKVQ